MALGSNKTLQTLTRGGLVSTVSLSSLWDDAIEAGGMDDADAATITNPTTEITLATRHPMRRETLHGTTLAARFCYDRTATGIVAPVIVIFGRSTPQDGTPQDGTPQPWQRLRTLSNNLSATMNVAATDTDDGTLKYTNPDNADHQWDMAGCDEFLVGVQTAHAVGGGSAALAKLQVRAI